MCLKFSFDVYYDFNDSVYLAIFCVKFHLLTIEFSNVVIIFQCGFFIDFLRLNRVLIFSTTLFLQFFVKSFGVNSEDSICRGPQ